MKDYIDIQERLSWVECHLFQHLFAFILTVLQFLYFTESRSSYGISIYEMALVHYYTYSCKGKIPAYLGSSFAFIAL